MAGKENGMFKQAVNMVLLQLWGAVGCSCGSPAEVRNVLSALHLTHRGRISKMMLKVADRAIRPSTLSWGNLFLPSWHCNYRQSLLNTWYLLGLWLGNPVLMFARALTAASLPLAYQSNCTQAFPLGVLLRPFPFLLLERLL